MALISAKKAQLQNNRDPFTIFILSQWLSTTHDNTLHLLHHTNTEGKETQLQILLHSKELKNNYCIFCEFPIISNLYVLPYELPY